MNKEQGEQVGWPRLVAATASAWGEIPVGQRDRAVVFAANYGEAGAIARYGPEHGLPRPYSGHMSFASLGPPPDAMDGPVVVVTQAGDRALDPFFVGCRPVVRNDNGAGVPNEEQGAVVALCTRPAAPWSRLWPDLVHLY